MNVFFSQYASVGHTWKITEAFDAGLIQGNPLVIAVWGEGGTKKFNPRRINEFLCDDLFAQEPKLWETLLPQLTPPTREPRGNYLIDLIADSILPYTLQHFGVHPSPKRTALMGCSVAGVHAAYATTKRPDAFGVALGLSSHWQFGGKALIGLLIQKLVELPEHSLIWSDGGDQGIDFESGLLNRYFLKECAERGLEDSVAGQTFKDTGHSETFWAERVHLPINWWLERTNSRG